MRSLKPPFYFCPTSSARSSPEDAPAYNRAGALGNVQLRLYDDTAALKRAKFSVACTFVALGRNARSSSLYREWCSALCRCDPNASRPDTCREKEVFAGFQIAASLRSPSSVPRTRTTHHAPYAQKGVLHRTSTCKYYVHRTSTMYSSTNICSLLVQSTMYMCTSYSYIVALYYVRCTYLYE